MAKRKTTQKQSKKVKCQNCGASNSIKSKFCHNCGAELEIQPEPVKKVVEKEAVQSEKEITIKKDKGQGVVIFGKFKPRFFIIIGVLIVAVALGVIAFSSNNSNSGKFAACTSDAQCSSGSYCSSFGGCLVSTCGDGVCSSQERQAGSCPIDCGCTSGQVLNKHTNQCQQPVNVSTQIITTYIDSYLNKNNLTGSITSIDNSYYGNSTVKEAIVNCQLNQTSYPCQIIFYFNQTGNVINVIRTD